MIAVWGPLVQDKSQRKRSSYNAFIALQAALQQKSPAR